MRCTSAPSSFMGAEVCMQSSRVVAFLILFLGFQCIEASGQQVVATWTDAGGDWSNPANWSTLTVPNNGAGTTYSVTISAPGSGVTMDVLNGVIDNLTLGTAAALHIRRGSTLSLASGASSNNGSLGIEGGGPPGGGSLLNNSGAHFTNNGSITLLLEGASFANSGIFNNNSEISLI